LSRIDWIGYASVAVGLVAGLLYNVREFTNLWPFEGRKASWNDVKTGKQVIKT